MRRNAQFSREPLDRGADAVLLLVMMLMTNDRKLMGERANGWSTNLLGGLTTLATFAATACLVVSWL